MVDCDPETDPETWTGYEVELFKRVAEKLNWPMEQMEWKCMAWSEVEDKLIAGDGSCDVAAMGLNAWVDYIEEGIVFSWPTYANSLIIVVSDAQQSVNIWAFLDAFEWQLWVVIIVTSFGVGLVVFAVDSWIVGVKYDKKRKKIIAGTGESNDREMEFLDYIWDALTRPTQRPLSVASNCIVLAFSLMMLVIVTVYTANTTANITATRLESTIRGVEDLPGKAVGTWEDYLPDMKKLGVTAKGFPWETDEDEVAMLDSLKNGSIQALVLDEPFLVYRTSSICEVTIVGQQFNKQSTNIAFASDFNSSEVLKAVNQALAVLREDGSIKMLTDTFISPQQAPCKASLVDETSNKISVSQLAGLWVMLAVGIAFALIITVIYKLHLRYTKKHIDKVGIQMKRSLTHTLST